MYLLTKNGNLMSNYEIYDTRTGIVVAEFISTENAKCRKFGMYRFGYWNYLRTRKDYICRGMGLNPKNFEIR